jgi:hypothetical protein
MRPFSRVRRFSVGLVVLSVGLGAMLPTVADDERVPDTVLSRYRMSAAAVARLEASGIEFQVEARKTDRRGGTFFHVLVPRSAVARAAGQLESATLLEADLRDEIARIPAATRASYHDYAEVKAHLERLERENPELVQIEIYGQSRENRDLFAVHLAKPLAAANFRPGLLLTGGTHGDELIGVETLLHVLEQTIAGAAGGDPVITAALEEFTLYFVPVVNPDGFVRRERYANGVDPNRDFPWPGQPSKRPNPAIASLMEFIHRHNVVGAIDWHAYGRVVGYPWSYQRQPLSNESDRQAHQRIAAAMGRAASYRSGQIPDVLYVAQGTSGDWYYWQRNALAFVIEIGDEKIPSPTTWPQRFRENTSAYKVFLSEMTKLQTARGL